MIGRTATLLRPHKRAWYAGEAQSLRASPLAPSRPTSVQGASYHELLLRARGDIALQDASASF